MWERNTTYMYVDNKHIINITKKVSTTEDLKIVLI